jgi:hypothetical protein
VVAGAVEAVVEAGAVVVRLKMEGGHRENSERTEE